MIYLHDVVRVNLWVIVAATKPATTNFHNFFFANCKTTIIVKDRRSVWSINHINDENEIFLIKMQLVMAWLSCWNKYIKRRGTNRITSSDSYAKIVSCESTWNTLPFYTSHRFLCQFFFVYNFPHWSNRWLYRQATDNVCERATHYDTIFALNNS